MNRLNIFNPYKDKEQSHEDVLTRNFLILVRNIPSVQMAFFELIRNEMPDIGFESMAFGNFYVSEVYTQVSSNGLLTNIKNEGKVLSVLISDETYENNHVVQESTRKARYDGIIICEPSWIFVIENKPWVKNVWEGQLDPSKEDVNGKELIKEPCCLSWHNIIEVLSSLIELNQLSMVERNLIEDFLAYINENDRYSYLKPYKTFSMCKNNKWLIDRRCGDILTEIYSEYGKDLKYHKGWKYYIDTADTDSIVREVALDYTEDGIQLWMYAGDTMVSSRRLYEKLRVEELKKLVSDGYILRPNFHISFRGTGLAWFDTTNISLEEYVNYWKSNEPRQKSHDELEEYYKGLVSKKVIDGNDEYIKDRILEKKYAKLNICPGLYFGFKWSIEEAEREDKAGHFKGIVYEKIKRIQSVYN